ncbi:MAG: isoprenylcysteine carboxylmethyltransferase family protein [Pseudomonadota bacterium]|nr:isoprenylcysteine carboxylmethyltransferase family protein [Pseudomonadota bacterium]
MELGIKRLGHDLRFRRDRYRQFLGIAYIALLTFVGWPTNYRLFLLGTALVIGGELFRLWASGFIKKDKELASGGPYAMVRHPLYVGNITLLTGFCLASGLWWALPGMIAYLMLFYPPAIRREDAKLRRLFGSQWDSWARNTRALIPRAAPLESLRNGRWSLVQSLKENGEPVYAALMLAALYWLYGSPSLAGFSPF